MKGRLTFLFLFIGFIVHAQTPSFQMTIGGQEITSACVGTTITFTNTSSITAGNLRWDFGNGNNANGVNSTPYIYSAAGSFTVKLINTTDNSETSKLITINKNPTASINVNTTQSCVGYPVQFSGTADASIKYFYWTFGDGGSVTQQSTTTHAFNRSGTYNTYLYVEDINGCRSVPSNNQQIQIAGSSNVSFQANGNNYYSCDNSITFANTTSETGTTTYTWDFGDGTSSSLKDPGSHTYPHSGKYTVKLTAYIGDNSGCTPIFSKDIYIGKPNIFFSVPNEICSNSQVALNADVSPSDFKNTAKDILWSINGGAAFNGDTSYLQVGANAGTYQLTATNRLGCPNPTTQSITVKNGSNISLSVNPPYGICTSIPAVVTASVNDNSSVVKYYWDFREGGIDSSTTNIKSHQYSAAGNYLVYVSALNSEGCTTTKTVSIPVTANCVDNGLGSVYNELFSFTSSGCANKYLVTFTSKDTSKTVSGWEIDNVFHAATNGSLTILLTKAKNANYDVVTDYTDGTKGKSKTITIVDEKAAFDILNKDNALLFCAQNNFVFSIDSTVNINNVSSLQWTIIDTITKKTIVNTTDNSGTLNYILPGASTYSIKLLLTDKRVPGCTSDTTKIISTKGPVLDFGVLQDSSFCGSNASVIFKNKTTTYPESPITRVEWGFGDGINIGFSGNIDTVSHTYQIQNTNPTSSYTVGMRVYDSLGCSAYIEKTRYINLYNPQVSFNTADTILCSSRKILIDNTSSAATPAVYTWTVGDTSKVYQNRSDLNLNVTVNSFPKYYDVRLHVKDAGGCEKDTLIKNYIKFLKPSASFKLNNPTVLNACPPYTLDMLSESQNVDSLSWSLGDGSESSDVNPLYTVLHPGEFKIKLNAIGYDGCSDSITQTYVARGPVAKLAISDSIGCTPFRTNLKIVSNSTIVSYQWNYGDGNTYINDTASEISHTYATLGNYWPTVTIIGDEGCSDNLHLTDSIIVKHLSPSFKLLNGGVFCNRDTAFFSNTTELNSFPINKFVWNWDDSTSNEVTVVDSIKHVFSGQKSSYKVSLTAITDFCTASDSLDVAYHLMPKITNINANTTFCLNDTLKAKVYVTNTENTNNSFEWYVGNNQLNSSDSIIDLPVNILANDLNVKVITEAGCTADTSISLLIHQLPTIKITAQDSTICIGDTTNLMVSGAASYTWLTQNKLLTVTDSLASVFPSLGAFYMVKGTDNNGCSSIDSFYVKVDNKVGLSFQDHYDFCSTDTSGVLLQVTAVNANRFEWTSMPIDSSLANLNSSSIRVYPKATTTYMVNAVSSNVCPDEQGSILVSAYDLPTISFASSVITKGAGEVFTLDPIITNSSPGLKYHWTPEEHIDNPFSLNPNIVGDKNTTYTLHITSSYGCSAIDSVTVNILCNGSKLLMANAFTPNGDGINDRFYVTGYGIQTVNSFIIIDRWGKKVFERNNVSSNDISQGWDGNINSKPATPGTYLYLVNLTCSEGEKFSLRGSVVLIR